MHRPRLLVIVGLAVVASFAMGVYGATLFTRAGDDTSAQVSAQFESAISSSADANLLVAGLSGSAVQAESIKVHGKWTLEVRNPDGTLVLTRVFHNSLDTFSGKNLLSSVLAGNITVMGWRIAIESFTAGQELCILNASPRDCSISAAADPRSGDQNFFPTLTVTGDSGHTGTGKLVLTGSITAQATGVIDRVTTRIRYGAGAEAYSFTKKSITPESVSAGQTVGVTVEISFE